MAKVSAYHLVLFPSIQDAKQMLKEIQNENQTEAEETVNEFDQSLLYIHQVATRSDVKVWEYYQFNRCHIQNHKVWTSTFLCVKTNVGYSIVADFIIQFETSSHIEEALKMLKKWNPSWCPSHFVCDYSDAEISALKSSFPAVKVYVTSTENKLGNGGSKTKHIV